MGDQDARGERLIRDIMAKDNVSWEDAQPRFEEIVSANRKGLFLYTLPSHLSTLTRFTLLPPSSLSTSPALGPPHPKHVAHTLKESLLSRSSPHGLQAIEF